MNYKKRTSALFVLVLLASLLLAIFSRSANAAESVPALQWPTISVGYRDMPLVESPAGSITLPCRDMGQDLVTYNAAGQQVRKLDRTDVIDGVPNCINNPVVDKNDTLYGIPAGRVNGNWMKGANLLAYAGNTLKWKYPVRCGNDQGNDVVVGANGTIYTTVYNNGVHLIGLTPEVEPGTNQPKKIVDVVLPNDCSIRLQAYKDGIMAHGQLSGAPRYYSYSGKELGAATIGNIWYEKLNADGQLFVGKYVSGSYQSASVDMYDPRTAKVRTTPASTPGANVNSIQVYPLQGGSVAALVNEQKMVSGVPATPQEYVDTLVTINSGGAVTKATQLAKLYSQNGVTGTFRSTLLATESNGKVVVIRELSLNTGLSWPPTASAIAIGVYNPAGGTWDYQAVMQGDLGKSGGPSGYYLDYVHIARAMAVTNGTLNFLARCTNNCANYESKLYAVKVAGLGMSYPRGVVTGTSPRSTALYVASGDSFSSGEGVSPFDAVTNLPDVNKCHRSEKAYPRLIAESSPKIPPLGMNGFRACSGAVTDNIGDAAQWNEGIQLDWWPDTTTRLVTLTIGGNDIKFADFGRKCVFETCEIGSLAYNNSLNKINNELSGKLEATYRRVLDYAPNAKVYVLGYPQVVDSKSVTDPSDTRCLYLQDGTTKWADARAARDIVTKLNDKIEAIVAQVKNANPGNQRLVYVPLDEPNSPFIGHEVCGTASSSWFQNIDQGVGDPTYVFHPNALGQEGYATVAGAAINAG